MSVQRIVPSIWCNRTAAEAAEFYCAALPGAAEIGRSHYPTEGLLDFQEEFAGDVLTVELDLDGLPITLINAGAEFAPTPALSFLLNFDPSRDPSAGQNLDRAWSALSDGGTTIMALDAYEHSPHYGWVEDRFGVSWQLMLTNPEGEPRPFATPCFLFGGAAQGRASEAMREWIGLIDDSGPGMTVARTSPDGPARAGDILFADFRLAGQWFAAMDATVDMDTSFTPGLSLQAMCGTQEDIDRLWAVLSTVPEAEQCGWCIDRFGVSWQVVPHDIGELVARPGSYERMLQMKRIVVAEL